MGCESSTRAWLRCKQPEAPAIRYRGAVDGVLAGIGYARKAATC
jgi:hypothetical protein